MEKPSIFIIAGPNGAGKTTFAKEFLPNEGDCLFFLNADLIASGLSPFAPEKVAIKAAKLMLEQIENHVQKKESLSFETTLSGKSYLRKITRWQESGYKVILIFLKLDDVETAVKRVEQRVKEGGHFIPEEVIRRRYYSGLKNLSDYKKFVNEWNIFRNYNDMPVLLERGKND